MQQGTAAWHSFRAKGIGASEVAAILGICPYRTAEDVLLDKIGQGKPFKTNPAMALGTKWEPAARARYFFESGHDCEPGVHTHPATSYFRASTDGDDIVNSLFIEIKFMGLKNFSQVTSDAFPLEHHWVQMQHIFNVTGFKRSVYVPYTLDEQRKSILEIAYIPVERNQAFIHNDLEPKLHEFWSTVLKKQKGS